MAIKRQVGLLGLVLGALAVPMTVQDASAGYRSLNGTVWVDAAQQWAGGALGFTYNTDNDVEYLGCGVTQYSDSSVSVYCYAQDLEGDYASCWSDNPVFANSVYGLTADSHLNFLAWPDGTCRLIQVQNSSYEDPKVL
jgi:hypothetical protein